MVVTSNHKDSIRRNQIMYNKVNTYVTSAIFILILIFTPNKSFAFDLGHKGDDNITIVDIMQMTPVQFYYGNETPPYCYYSEFHYMAVINKQEERYVKTILVRIPSAYKIDNVKINGVEAVYVDYPPKNIQGAQAYVIPALKQFKGKDMEIEVSLFSGEGELKKITVRTMNEHWGFLEKRLAAYMFD